jgi:hypothetical protein
MKIHLSLAIVGLSAMVLMGSTEATHDSMLSPHQLRGRDLTTTSIPTNCLGSTLNRNHKIDVGESICAVVNNETVYFGIWEHPMPSNPGYTLYQVELRSELGTYNRKFSGLGTQGSAPEMKLQGDGNLVFGDQSFSGCETKPGTEEGDKQLIIKEEASKLVLKIFDDQDAVVWKLHQHDNSLGGFYMHGSTCYPDTPDSCVTTLKKDHRLSWKDYVCQYDSEGDVSFKFGLSEDGLLGLWRYSQLIWRPSGGNLRGDYLHFQDDGHLTLYRDTSPNKMYEWTSDDCTTPAASKLTLTGDGDVIEMNDLGGIVWTLRGSQLEGVPAPADPRDSVKEVCMPGCPAV